MSDDPSSAHHGDDHGRGMTGSLEASPGEGACGAAVVREVTEPVRMWARFVWYW